MTKGNRLSWQWSSHLQGLLHPVCPAALEQSVSPTDELQPLCRAAALVFDAVLRLLAHLPRRHHRHSLIDSIPIKVCHPARAHKVPSGLVGWGKESVG